MTTWRPSAACQNVAISSSTKVAAGSGWCSQATRAMRSAPASPMTAATNHKPSGTSAIAVTRWRDQCSTPSLAEPRPRARPSGERRGGSAISAAPARQPGDPGGERQQRGRRDDDPAAGIDGLQLQGVAGIPPQMPDAVAEMVEQRDAPAEQQQQDRKSVV